MLFDFQTHTDPPSYRPMVTPVFLGWDQPFLLNASEWLLAQRDSLPQWLLVVPTSQAGRRLRETMAQQAGAMLTPKIMTPGALMQLQDASVASNWVEHIAWLETLEQTNDWDTYQDLFPIPPDDTADWATGMAGELLALRRKLQENGLTLKAAARMLSQTIEGNRWQALAQLEQAMEQRLQAWGYKSRSRLLADGIKIPEDITHVVLVGTSEIPPIIERSLSNWGGTVTSLVGAPPSEVSDFTEFGKPLPSWNDRHIPWPNKSQGAVHLVANTREQARQALAAASEAKSKVDEVALGSADTEAGNAVAETFTQHGWIAFHPAAKSPISGLRRWLKTWSSWMLDSKFSTMMDLLGLPETSALIGNHRAALAENLSKLRNDWMIIRPDDLRHRMSRQTFRSDSQKAVAESVLKATETLEQWRAMLQRNDFIEPLERLLTAMESFSESTAEQTLEIHSWLNDATPMIQRLSKDARFWIDLMLGDLPPPSPKPPDDRVIDVQGWLELFFEPGQHLILCGMNEGKVPASSAGDPWLGDSAAKFLGLPANTDRSARDAYLLCSMVHARLKQGHVDLICAKTSDTGEPMLPSRLLLAAPPDELPQRVQQLFRSIEPPESKLRWERDWQWLTPNTPVSRRLSATSLKDYLECPLRFFLKHGSGMQSPEPERVEWNARDFGNCAHEIMERWGRDENARSLTSADAIHDWTSTELDRLVDEWFGNRVPLAVRIQTESLRQRLLWFSHTQAQTAADGWEVLEVEHKFEIPSNNSVIVAKIDRIDRHRETGLLRVIDYKTGKVNGVDSSHRTKFSEKTKLPEHIDASSPVIHEVTRDQKGAANYRWLNLQLPLYALAIQKRDSTLATPCYFTLGETRAGVDIHEWTDFSQDDVDSAQACADWITGQIEAGIFGPPAEKVKYDDYSVLGAGRPLADMFATD